MKRFFKKLALFVMPPIVVLAFPAFVLFASGEIPLDIDKVIREQAAGKREVLFWPAYSNNDAYYKLKSVNARNPKTIVMGTSRVLQFRSEFFRDPSSFYNAGRGVVRIEHFSEFIDGISPDKEIKLIILGLNQPGFNPNWKNFNKGPNDPPQESAMIFRHSWWQVYQDYYEGKFKIGHVLHNSGAEKKTGLLSRIRETGFRNDGCIIYHETWEPPNFEENLKRIQEGVNRFEHGQKISARSVKELIRFFDKCRERNIHVVAFLPAHAHVLYESMRNKGDDYEYIFKLEETLRPIFDEYSYPLFDFSDMASLGAGDEEASDGFHISEKAALRALIIMAEGDAKLRGYVDLDNLRRILAQSTHPRVLNFD